MPSQSPQPQPCLSRSSVYLLLSLCALPVLCSPLCAPLSVGSSPHSSDLVSEGKVSPSYSPRGSSPPVVVSNQQSEYLYVRWTGQGSLSRSSFRLAQQAKDVSMVLFKVEPEGDMYSISLLYYCTPLTNSDTNLVFSISPPGCEKVEFGWRVSCGNSLSRF